MADEVFIPVNRRKMIFLTIFFGLLGIFMFLAIYYLGENQDWMSPTVFKFASVIALFFFMIVAGTYAKNIRNKEIGITLSRVGIGDRTSSIGTGLIKWADITEVSYISERTSKLMLIHVKKAQKIIDKAPNGAVKRLLERNNTIYKTPVVIDVGALAVDLPRLEEVIENYSKKFKKK